VATSFQTPTTAGKTVLSLFYVGTSDRKYQFWERNPLSIPLYSLPVMMQKLTYIHLNPIQEKWKLAQIPEDYWYSSTAFYLNGFSSFGFLTPYTDDFL